MEETQNNTRVRLNLGLTAKGFAQWDITSEFPTVDEAKKGLEQAIDAVRDVIRAKGLEEAHA